MIIADQIIDVLCTVGKNGLSIKELETRLGIDYKVITETLEHLISEGIVMQKQDTDGIKYYYTKDTPTNDSTGSRFSDINGCPCFHCPKIYKCGVKQIDSPLACKSLDDWIAGGSYS